MFNDFFYANRAQYWVRFESEKRQDLNSKLILSILNSPYYIEMILDNETVIEAIEEGKEMRTQLLG